MTTSNVRLLSSGERVLVEGRGLSEVSSEIDPREGLLDRRNRATSGGTKQSLQPAAMVPVVSAFRSRRAPGTKGAIRLARDGFALDAPADEDDRMRLLAALLVLGTLLIWILFLGN